MTATVVDARAYNISIRGVELEDEDVYEARVAELPDLCLYGEDPVQLYFMAIEAVELAAEEFRELGRTDFPSPMIPKDRFSGRVTLRMPKSLHQILAQNARHEQTSLNQYLLGLISYRGGARQALGRPVIRPLKVDFSQESPPIAANQDNYKLAI